MFLSNKMTIKGTYLCFCARCHMANASFSFSGGHHERAEPVSKEMQLQKVQLTQLQTNRKLNTTMTEFVMGLSRGEAQVQRDRLDSRFE